MLGRKLHSGTSKTKKLVPVQPDIPLLCPSINYSVPCDRAKGIFAEYSKQRQLIRCVQVLLQTNNLKTALVMLEFMLYQHLTSSMCFECSFADLF